MKKLYPLQINPTLSIITFHKDHKAEMSNFLEAETKEQIVYDKSIIFSDKNISIAKALKILRKNGFNTNEEQAKEIFNFLYQLTNTHLYKSSQDIAVNYILRRNLTL